MKQHVLLCGFCTAMTALAGAGIAASGIDTDGDARYSLAELRVLYPTLTPAVYARIDADGDGWVSPGEFRAGQDEGLLVAASGG